MPVSLASVEALQGQSVGRSGWYDIDQNLINTFAQATQDHQFIHVDPDRAKSTEFGGTIAHGFLTLSLLSAMAEEATLRPKGVRMSINYGFDKIRFLAPVPSGARVRAEFSL